MDFVQSMASSSSSTVPSSERTSHFSCQTEMEMEFSKARHWSQLDHPTPDSEGLAESNHKYFALLKEDPQWSRFFTDFEALEVGEKISGGAQGDIYEARNTCDGPFNLVVKVMKADAPLKTFHAQWPIGMLSARSKYKHLFDLPLITILGGTMLRDRRLRGRFAFVMYRRWGDLRLLIDRRMKQESSRRGPFLIGEAIHLMLSIAKDMDTLHNKHDILHRDLKASNVLVWGDFGEDMNLTVTSNRVAKIGSVVADFECSVGVKGTRFWRAPEILEQCMARVPSAEIQFTRASDVYSYGMICYEIITGCIPYDGHGGISQILDGQRPELPHELPEFVRDIIVGCWHTDPLERPSFSTIWTALKLKRSPNKVEKWNNPQALKSAGTPNFKPYAAPETTSTSDSASPYDMGLIPDTRIFFSPKRPSVSPTSRAETFSKKKGIYSHHPLLDNNPEELWRFLVSNLQSPHMAVRIVGTHTVTTTSGTGPNSSTSTTTITDFSIQLDVSQYVNPQWSRIFTRPSRMASKDAVTPTVRETLEEYAGSKNAFKEIRLLKRVEWDFEELTKSLEELVRSTGYRSTVSITFPMQAYKVVALASNDFCRAANSKVVRVLCVVSCLFLVFWPVWAIARKRMKNRLVCAYGMGVSGEVFYARNQRQIYNLVEQRFKQEFKPLCN